MWTPVPAALTCRSPGAAAIWQDRAQGHIMKHWDIDMDKHDHYRKINTFLNCVIGAFMGVFIAESISNM